MPRYCRLSERSRAAAQVAEHVVRAGGLDLHAGSMATERTGDGKAEPVNVGFDRFLGGQRGCSRALDGRDQTRS